MKKKLSVKKMSVTTVMAAAALVIASATFLFVLKVNAEMYLWNESAMQNEIQRIDRSARFEFCFNNDIRPCDDISIKEFNATHAEEDQFNL